MSKNFSGCHYFLSHANCVENWCSKIVKAKLWCIPKSTQINFLLMQFGWKGFPQHHTTSYIEKTHEIYSFRLECAVVTVVLQTQMPITQKTSKNGTCVRQLFNERPASSKYKFVLFCAMNAGKQSHNLDWLRGKRRDSLIRRLGCCWTQSFWIFTNLIMKPKDASSESICV